MRLSAPPLPPPGTCLRDLSAGHAVVQRRHLSTRQAQQAVKARLACCGGLIQNDVAHCLDRAEILHPPHLEQTEMGRAAAEVRQTEAEPSTQQGQRPGRAGRAVASHNTQRLTTRPQRTNNVHRSMGCMAGGALQRTHVAGCCASSPRRPTWPTPGTARRRSGQSGPQLPTPGPRCRPPRPAEKARRCS